jgi:hypothetical protein
MNSPVAIEKLNKQIKVTYSGTEPARIILKANFLNSTEYKLPKFEGPGSQIIDCDSDIWFNGTILPVVCPIPKSILGVRDPIKSDKVYHSGGNGVPFQSLDTTNLSISTIPSTTKVSTQINGKDTDDYVPVSKSVKTNRKSFPKQLSSAAQVRGAMTYFNYHKFSSKGEMRHIARKLLRQAKKCGVKVKADSKVSQAAKSIFNY